MEISVIDILVIVVYLIIVALIGSLSGGRQKSTADYFMGGKNVPWWAVSFSIVAAETSSLTFISIPGLAYITNLHFLQLTMGYLIARILVAVFFLPSYRKGELATAYTFLEDRFGKETRRYASSVFLFTRIAADGVRLFSTAIPLALIFKTSAFFEPWSNFQIYVLSIVIITTVSLIYTYTGGVKGVIWADVLQMVIYIGGALLAFFILMDKMPAGFSLASLGKKTEVFNLDFGQSISDFFGKPYTLIASLIGGTFLSMASHGTDQLIVQRLLTTKNLRDSQKAVIGSGVMVVFQFALFLVVGLLLYVFFKGVVPGSEGVPFHKADEIFPYFILHYLPVGVKGFIIAGLFAAAMSTLAGSISSLSSSAMLDLYKPLRGNRDDARQDLKISRLFTIGFAFVLTIVAFFFIQVQQSVVEIALGIASITYGGLLGTFLLGRFFKAVQQPAAMAGFTSGILIMLLIILVPKIAGIPAIMHWTWFVVTGAVVCILVGNLWQRFVAENKNG
ncbi:MAG: sodium:solute symporter [Calditrichales bacterium]|nr:MAG: sodium:solute symporter [Calditrichales bacterium]